MADKTLTLINVGDAQAYPIKLVDMLGDESVYALKVSFSGADETVGVQKVEERFTYSGPKLVDTLVKSGAGFLHALQFSCNDAAPTAGTITVYDNTEGSGTVIFTHTFTTTPFLPFPVVFDVSFATGLYFDFTTTGDVNVSASYR